MDNVVNTNLDVETKRRRPNKNWDDVEESVSQEPNFTPNGHYLSLLITNRYRNTLIQEEDDFDQMKEGIFEETKKIMHLEHKKKMECMVRLMEDESRAKIRLLEVESQTRIGLQEVESQTRIKLMEEEHQIKMLLLKDGNKGTAK